jgi:hypothetical protein
VQSFIQGNRRPGAAGDDADPVAAGRADLCAEATGVVRPPWRSVGVAVRNDKRGTRVVLMVLSDEENLQSLDDAINFGLGAIAVHLHWSGPTLHEDCEVASVGYTFEVIPAVVCQGLDALLVVCTCDINGDMGRESNDLCA